MDNKKTLNLKSKLYQKQVMNRIEEIDWEKGSDSPYVVELDPTTACDLACPGCISADLLNHGGLSNKRLMDLGKEFVDAGVKAVVLIGGGEPLNHPSIGKLIKYLGDNDVHIGLTTNGTKIDKYIDEIREYVQWTRVSVDAATTNTFKYLRPSHSGESKFDKVISNMRLLAKNKKGIVGFSYLLRTNADGDIEKNNIDEIYKAAELARDIGCDYFEIKPSYDMNHFLVVHNESLMKRAQEEVARLYELETEDFKILKSINLDFTLENENLEQPKEYTTCPISELRTLVTPSGVYVCPYFRGRGDMKVGDITNMTFSSMWKHQEREKVMNYLNPSIHCKMHCIRHDSNQILLELEKKFDKNLIVKNFNRFI